MGVERSSQLELAPLPSASLAFISHTFIFQSRFESYPRSYVRNESGNKTNSKIYCPGMSSLIFLHLLEYLMLPHPEKHRPIDQNQLAYQSSTNCILALPLLKSTNVLKN